MESDALLWLSVLIVVISSIVSVGCWLWVVCIAFGKGIMSGLFSLFCGLYWLYFAAVNWGKCKVPLCVCIACSFVNLGLRPGIEDSKDKLEASLRSGQAFNMLRTRGRIGEDAVVDEEAAERDRKTLLGEWVVVTSSGSDQEIGEKFTFDMEHCTVRSSRVMRDFSLVVSPTNADNRIDLVAGESRASIEGLYRISGDELELCLGRPGDKRPNRFASEGNSQRIFVLKRQ